MMLRTAKQRGWFVIGALIAAYVIGFAVAAAATGNIYYVVLDLGVPAGLALFFGATWLVMDWIFGGEE